MQNKTNMDTMCKWIIDLGAIKHMSSRKAALGTYVANTPLNNYLGDDTIMEIIRMDMTAIKVML